MTLLRVDRYLFNKDNTISKLYQTGELFCYGIEDEKRKEKVHGETCIPDGIYQLGARTSPRFSKYFYTRDGVNLITQKEYLKMNAAAQKLFKPHELIWIKNVPGFEYILLHWGNTDDDTDGCYIVGNMLGVVGKQEAVLNSRFTYQKLYSQVIACIKAGGQKIEYRSV